VECAPIRRGANRPQGRPRRALVPVLLRLLAVAGFAFAGWVALSALADSAFAAERPPQAVQAGDRGPATLRHLTSRPARRTMADDVREIGGDPMRYVRSRQHDLFGDKDRAVSRVRELADAAGVPHVRVPHVRVPDVRSERPILRGLVQRVTEAPSEGRPAAAEPAEAPDGKTSAAHDRDDAVPAPRPAAGAAKAAAERKPAGCARCAGDHRAPAHAPVLPPVQDGPHGGSAGGHPFPPVGDLPGGRAAAAPPAVDAGTFQRTALTDVAAPGGPSVVPD
jgi:hypothetical protein